METKKTSICLKCKNEVELTVKFCSNCGYPQHGTIQDKKRFRVQNQIKQNKLKEVELAATVGKSVLFIIGVLYLLSALFTNNPEEQYYDLIVLIEVIEASIYIALGFWAKKKLLAATLTGLLFYFTMFVIGILVNPYSVLLIGFKILFFILLIVSVTSARKYEKLKKEFE